MKNRKYQVTITLQLTEDYLVPVDGNIRQEISDAISEAVEANVSCEMEEIIVSKVNE